MTVLCKQACKCPVNSVLSDGILWTNSKRQSSGVSLCDVIDRLKTVGWWLFLLCHSQSAIRMLTSLLVSLLGIGLENDTEPDQFVFENRLIRRRCSTIVLNAGSVQHAASMPARLNLNGKSCMDHVLKSKFNQLKRKKCFQSVAYDDLIWCAITEEHIHQRHTF